jgi:uncharacterized protein YoxC
METLIAISVIILAIMFCLFMIYLIVLINKIFKYLNSDEFAKPKRNIEIIENKEKIKAFFI